MPLILVFTFKSPLSPAVSLLAIINIKRAEKAEVIASGSLSHQLAIGSTMNPVAIAKGKLRLGGPPNLSRLFSD